MDTTESKRRILVVDDEIGITRLLKLIIERSGPYEVRTEHTGLMALAAAREFKPDLILMDILMPGMSGSEAAGEMRKDPELQKIPLVFLTGAVRETHPGAAVQLDGYRCLVKPLDSAAVLNLLRTVLGT
jgi:CheY-like chemotaxis protein